LLKPGVAVEKLDISEIEAAKRIFSVGRAAEGKFWSSFDQEE
jgi:hypothetical protein